MKINVPPCRNFSFYSQIKTNIERARVSCIHGDLQSGDGQSTVELKPVKAGGTFTTLGLFDKRSSESSHFFFLNIQTFAQELNSGLLRHLVIIDLCL